MDSLGKILKSHNVVQAPSEIKTIQGYILKKYKSPAKVRVRRGALIVTVPNSGLAATMHLEQHAIIKACKLENSKLVIRTGR
ncbi:hypothetical protein HYW36_02130 [Candidatus Saccharibacteria bacterium]|nr:hypothetical protein [Candidatus Saccharibacteria bacterium]